MEEGKREILANATEVSGYTVLGQLFVQASITQTNISLFLPAYASFS